MNTQILTNKKVTIFLSIILIACLTISILSYFAPQQCYADNEYKPKLVNFNQMVLDTYTHDYTMPFDTSTTISTQACSQYDKLYYKLDYTLNNGSFFIRYVDIGNDTYTMITPSQYEGIFTCPYASSSSGGRVLYFYSNTTGQIINNLKVINLTKMYGSGLEPSLEQCQEIFTAPYYNYNTGEPMYEYDLSSMGSIGELYKAEYTIYSSDWKKNDLYDTYTQQNTTTGYTEIFTNILYNDEVRTGSVIYTFTSRVPVGAIMTIEFTNLKNYNFVIYSNTGDELLSFYSANNTPSNSKRKFVIENVPVTQIFLMFGGNGISTPTISYESLVISVEYYTTQNELIENAYASGQQAMKDYYTRPNAGYEEIFNLGKNYGQAIAEQTTGGVTGNAWDFISSTLTSLGSFFSIELMPNITLGTFIAIPLLFGVLFFILKITRGE